MMGQRPIRRNIRIVKMQQTIRMHMRKKNAFRQNSAFEELEDFYAVTQTHTIQMRKCNIHRIQLCNRSQLPNLDAFHRHTDHLFCLFYEYISYKLISAWRFFFLHSLRFEQFYSGNSIWFFVAIRSISPKFHGQTKRMKCWKEEAKEWQRIIKPFGGPVFTIYLLLIWFFFCGFVGIHNATIYCTAWCIWHHETIFFLLLLSFDVQANGWVLEIVREVFFASFEFIIWNAFSIDLQCNQVTMATHLKIQLNEYCSTMASPLTCGFIYKLLIAFVHHIIERIFGSSYFVFGHNFYFILVSFFWGFCFLTTKYINKDCNCSQVLFILSWMGWR